MEPVAPVALISHLGLEPIPVEGGWFRVTWRSATAGAIVALFTDDADGFSALHRLDVTELWFAHGGDPFELLLLHPDGSSEVVVLGVDVLRGQDGGDPASVVFDAVQAAAASSTRSSRVRTGIARAMRGSA